MRRLLPDPTCNTKNVKQRFKIIQNRMFAVCFSPNGWFTICGSISRRFCNYIPLLSVMLDWKEPLLLLEIHVYVRFYVCVYNVCYVCMHLKY